VIQIEGVVDTQKTFQYYNRFTLLFCVVMVK
jgi:hypothetical protein